MKSKTDQYPEPKESGCQPDFSIPLSCVEGGCLKSLLKHLTTEETEIKQSSQRFDIKKVTSLRTL